MRAVMRGLWSVYLHGYAYIWANLAFVALCLPVLTAPAAFSALMRVGHAALKNPHEADLGLFWETFRGNLWRAFPWGVAHLAFAIINFTNLTSYAGPFEGVLRGVWWWMTGIWVLVVLFTWPVYYEMERPALLLASWNAFLIVLKNPLLMALLVMLLIALAVFSTVLVAAWLLLTWGALAAVANAVVLDRLYPVRANSEVQKSYAVH